MRGYWGQRAVIGLLAAMMLSGCQAVRHSKEPQGASSSGIIGPVFFSHDGKKVVAFKREPKLSGFSAWLIDFKQKKESQLLSSGSSDVAAWSPDDHYLAVSKALKKDHRQLGIFDLQTGTWKSIVSRCPSSLVMSSFPAWSPDGRQIIFDGLVESPMELFIVCLYEIPSGKCRPQVVGNIRKSGSPFWQNRIVYSVLSGTSEDHSLRRRFYTCRPTAFGGKEVREVLPDKFIEEMGAAANTPYAAALCREDSLGASDSNTEYTLYILKNADNPVIEKSVSGKFIDGGILTFHWSRDGEKLLMRISDGVDNYRKTQIVMLSAATGKVVKLTDKKKKPIYGINPEWVDNDKAVCYSTFNGSYIELWRYDLARKETTRLYPFP